MLNTDQQRQLGKEISEVLDRYGLQGTDRIYVLLQVTWGEACLLNVGSIKLMSQAVQVWKENKGIFR